MGPRDLTAPEVMVTFLCEDPVGGTAKKHIICMSRRDSQTGCPPKSQLRSWKIQFTLTLNQTVIVFKTKNPTAAVPPSICIGTLCVGIRFALIRFQGTLRCQDSSPNEAPVSRTTGITATNEVGNVHENNWIFVRKFIV